MNEPICAVLSYPETQATACRGYQLLKRGYESALRETALYECGGGASFQQAIRYAGEAKALCAAAGKYLVAHRNGCPVCAGRCRNLRSTRQGWSLSETKTGRSMRKLRPR
jgi:hypothetical protein